METVKMFQNGKWYRVVNTNNIRGGLLNYVFSYYCEPYEGDCDEFIVGDYVIYHYNCEEIEDPFSTNCKLDQENVILKSVIKDKIHDNVNSPAHYKLDGLDIESKDVIRALLGREMYLGWLWGNMLKYSFRWNKKNGIEDLQKARKFNEWVEELESEGE